MILHLDTHFASFAHRAVSLESGIWALDWKTSRMLFRLSFPRSVVTVCSLNDYTIQVVGLEPAPRLLHSNEFQGKRPATRVKNLLQAVSLITTFDYGGIARAGGGHGRTPSRIKPNRTILAPPTNPFDCLHLFLVAGLLWRKTLNQATIASRARSNVVLDGICLGRRPLGKSCLLKRGVL
jgi:hypothetical protein